MYKTNLWESDEKYDVNSEESQKISNQHPINHRNKRTNHLKASAEKQEIWSSKQDSCNSQNVLKGNKTNISIKALHRSKPTNIPL